MFRNLVGTLDLKLSVDIKLKLRNIQTLANRMNIKCVQGWIIIFLSFVPPLIARMLISPK